MTAKESETSSPPEPSSSIITTCSNRNIMELPSELHSDILSRISSRSLFSCRAVCKAFLDILSTQYFIKLSHSRKMTIKVIQRKNSAFFESRSPPNGNLPSLTRIFYFPSFGHETRKMLNSVNGIICLCFDIIKKPVYAIWNPLLRQITLLPKIQELDEESTYLGYSALGSCRRGEVYKIIRFETYKGKPVIRVLTLGTGNWRLIEEGVKAPVPERFLETFLKGAIHWITADGIGEGAGELIYSFDIEKETLKPIPAPVHFDKEYVKNISWVHLLVIGGALHLRFQTQMKCELWVMNDYGVKESWTRKSVINRYRSDGALDGMSLVFYKSSFVRLQDITTGRQLPKEVQT